MEIDIDHSFLPLVMVGSYLWLLNGSDLRNTPSVAYQGLWISLGGDSHEHGELPQRFTFSGCYTTACAASRALTSLTLAACHLLSFHVHACSKVALPFFMLTYVYVKGSNHLHPLLIVKLLVGFSQ